MIRLTFNMLNAVQRKARFAGLLIVIVDDTLKVHCLSPPSVLMSTQEAQAAVQT